MFACMCAHKYCWHAVLLTCFFLFCFFSHTQLMCDLIISVNTIMFCSICCIRQWSESQRLLISIFISWTANFQSHIYCKYICDQLNLCLLFQDCFVADIYFFQCISTTFLRKPRRPTLKIKKKEIISLLRENYVSLLRLNLLVKTRKISR